MKYNTLDFEVTSHYCPEQYDVKLNGELVGYVRLRNGYMYVQCPWSGGEEVYSHIFPDCYKGCFSNDRERDYYLSKAENAILNYILEERIE